MGCVSAIAGHRHRGLCRRHRHFGIWHLSPVPEHAGTGLDPLIPVPDSSRHRHFNSFRYRTDWMPYSRAFRLLKTLYKGEEGYTLLGSTSGGKKGIHPARPHCSRRRWIHPARQRHRQSGIRVSPVPLVTD